MERLVSALGWLIDNLLNFTGHGAILALCLAVIGLYAGRRVLATGALAAALVCAVWVVVCHLPLDRPSSLDLDRRSDLRVMTFNVEGGVTEIEEKLAVIAQADPDLLVVQETLRRSRNPLFRQLRDRYPHRAVLGAPGGYVLSRYPLTRPVGVVSELANIRGFRTRINVNGVRIAVVAVQVTRPDRPSAWRQRNREYQELADAIARLDGPVIVAGDFNAGPLSPRFQAFLKASELTGLAPGWAPARTTWPDWLPGLGLAIDHILTKGALKSDQAGVLSSAGSNHRPLIVDLAVGAKVP